MKNNFVLKEFLKEQGLKKEEIDIYLFLIKFGPQSVGTIARGTNVKRSSCYDYVNKLKVKKFISVINIRGVMTVEAVDIEILLNKIHNDIYIEFNNSVRKINYLQNIKQTYKPVRTLDLDKIITYCNKNALPEIYEEALKSDFILAYFNGSFENERYSKIDNDYTLKRIDKKIPIKILLPNTSSSVRFIEKKRGQREVKFLNKSELPFEGLTLITQDKVLTFSAETNNGLCIKSPLLAKNQAAIFNLVWEKA